MIVLKEFSLEGKYVHLEPLNRTHLKELERAAAANPSLYRWSPVPQGEREMKNYLETALAGREAGSVLPFAVIRKQDGSLIGCTRFFHIEFWAWPEKHSRYGRSSPDASEIGYTWYTDSAIRTAANTETKLLMLTHAFENWMSFRVCFHADARNQISRSAIERIGGHFEGILRAHRLAIDHIPRDSARYSITDTEWTDVKRRLLGLLK